MSDTLPAAIRAAASIPTDPEAWDALGRCFAQARQPDLAVGAYRRALAIDPDRAATKGRLLHQQLLACDWRDLDALVAAGEAGVAIVDPFCWQAVSTSTASSCAVVARWEARRSPIARAVIPARAGTRIRIGYVSGEFYDHAMSVLMVGVWERHDRTRFDIIGFDTRPGPVDDADPMRRRVVAALGDLIPIGHLGSDDAVAAVRAAGIDVLVDLNGYYGHARPDVFRRGAAPVQVNYLGFPGTVGDGWMDYLLTDPVLVPDGESRFLTEAPVRLPRAYQPSDDHLAIAATTPGRAAHGLPETAFVFACFNNSYKIVPAMLDRWAEILARVEGSVLWLVDENTVATRNLRREAAARGIAPNRLVFAPRAPLADHLARHVRADLFLDTLPYGAHTTASIALWAGLPLLTTPGPTFPGRVAASLLTTLELPELIAPSHAAYADRAVALAHDPAALARIRTALADPRRRARLFDTVGFTRDLERAFAAMHDRAVAGLPPTPIDLAHA